MPDHHVSDFLCPHTMMICLCRQYEAFEVSPLSSHGTITVGNSEQCPEPQLHTLRPKYLTLAGDTSEAKLGTRTGMSAPIPLGLWTEQRGSHPSPSVLPCTCLLRVVLTVIVSKGKNSSTFKLHLHKLGQGLEAKVLAEGSLLATMRWPLGIWGGQSQGDRLLICLHSVHLAEGTTHLQTKVVPA